MAEFRWNPILREWVAVVETPPPVVEGCPYCSLSGDERVRVCPDPSPVMGTPPEAPTVDGDDFYRIQPKRGICESVVYHPSHNLSPAELDLENWRDIVHLWSRRFAELAADPGLNYVFVFEDREASEIYGNSHPHGKIYAYPFIPWKIQREIRAAWEHCQRTESCLFCKILDRELTDQVRIVAETSHFVAFVPFYARYPFEVHIYPRRHLLTLNDCSAEELDDLAKMQKWVVMKYDALFESPFPYRMSQHAAPVGEVHCEFFHWHVEFAPYHKGYAEPDHASACELGAGTYVNHSTAEEKAAQLREIGPRSL